MKSDTKLFHVSEDSGIKIFVPRPSPSYFEEINNPVVFSITDKLLHNYLLPRNCPRVTFYSKEDTTQEDRDKFFGPNTNQFVIAVENGWRETIKKTTLFCYELPDDTFQPLDKGAGYFISYKEVEPVSVWPVKDLIGEILKRDVDLRFMPHLSSLANEVSQSTLQYSLIRMRNAVKH